MQHYDVCPTPLVDITSSLRVACSFALNKNNNECGYIYVLGLPHITSTISVHNEDDLVNLKLLSICPPSATWPHFQEGYLICNFPTDLYTDISFVENAASYGVFSEIHDAAVRLVAKFKINNDGFWSNDHKAIPDSALFPDNDEFKMICDEVKTKINSST